MGIIANLFGTKNERELKKLAPHVQAIGAFEARLKPRSDTDLTNRILELRGIISTEVDKSFARIKGGPSKEQVNTILDPHLHEVFAIVREAGRRVLNMRHFDVQLVGGMVLNQGRIAEMKTGEGKTLVATLAAVFNSLTGRGVHVVTVNDYLASRDAEWMGRIYRFLGLSVGVVIPQTSDREKKEAYGADITYGQNNEFGFDYLRDNMKFSLEEYVQRGHNFAIVDEVDSILIDEARTPLIISGPAEDSTDKYQVVNGMIPKLRNDLDFSIDEKSRAVMLTEPGITKCEQLLKLENLYDPVNIEYLHHLNQSLRAHMLFKRDVDYVIERGEVIIVDEHTGRLMHGRRWSDGLHQAVEAKENVTVQAENHTLATITFQNLFRMYKKLSGMTGTADTEAEEFAKIYDLDVMVIPTNKPLIRKDENDLIYKTEREKFVAVAEDIAKSHKNGQPVLVGTVSVEKSEIISKLLKKMNVAHDVLNAKRHRDEASIVAQAGRSGSISIATNMAGRGTDIILGGDSEFMARSKVAKAMHETDVQIAEFGFLTGRPDLINTDRLADRDKYEVKYLVELENELEEKKKKGDKSVLMPKNIDEARGEIFRSRKSFYDQAVNLYAKELANSIEICGADKEQVLQAGGLRVIGTERHESRRIDNQLRGRSGRQGDPGSSSFYLSLQDDLMRIFGSDKMIGVMERLGMEEGVPIEHPWVSKSIANAQKRVEGFHFDSRKQLIEYDDVMNQQRGAIYGLRRKVLGDEDIKILIFDLVEQAVVNMVSEAAPEKSQASEWKLPALQGNIFGFLGVPVDLSNFSGDRDDLMDLLYREIEQFYGLKEKIVGSDLIRQVEKFIYLQTIDHRWKEHLQAMDHLREGIHFRGYAQKDPKQEYKKEGYTIFTSMVAHVRDEVLEKVFKAEVQAGSRERVEGDLSRLKERQRIEEERLKRTQVLGHGQENEAKKATPTKDISRASVSGGLSALPRRGGAQPLNRHQRRLMKSRDKKLRSKPGRHPDERQ